MRRWTSLWIAAGLLAGIAGTAIGTDPAPGNAVTAIEGVSSVAVRDAYAQHRADKVGGKEVP
jgi:hypothetical protein